MIKPSPQARRPTSRVGYNAEAYYLIVCNMETRYYVYSRYSSLHCLQKDDSIGMFRAISTRRKVKGGGGGGEEWSALRSFSIPILYFGR